MANVRRLFAVAVAKLRSARQVRVSVAAACSIAMVLAERAAKTYEVFALQMYALTNSCRDSHQTLAKPVTPAWVPVLSGQSSFDQQGH